MKKSIRVNLVGFFLIFFIGLSNANLFSDSNNDKAIYAQLSSFLTQSSLNPSNVSFEHVDNVRGLKFNQNNEIVIKEAGTYFLIAKGQAGSIAFAPPGNVFLWFSLNHHALSSTISCQYIQQNVKNDVVVTHATLDLKKGDTINVSILCDSSFLGLIQTPATGNKPQIPSINFSIFKINN